MPFETEMETFRQRVAHSMAMGGPDKIARRQAEGRLDARERINRLLDPGSFFEVGRLNHSDMPDVAAYAVVMHIASAFTWT